MTTLTYDDPKPTRKTKKSPTPVLVPADFEQRIRRSIALQREYNAELRELLELQLQLLSLETLKQREATNAKVN